MDTLESEARRRALDGVEKPVFYRGQKCGAIREYSDALLMFLMKAARPERFRESYDAHKIVALLQAGAAAESSR
ncbi:hypothetical protein ACYOEI_01645 [Singulisphaera rosea]